MFCCEVHRRNDIKISRNILKIKIGKKKKMCLRKEKNKP